MRMNARLGLLFRISISLLAIGALFYLIDLNLVVDRLRQLRPIFVPAIILLILLQSVVIAARWSFVANFCNAGLGIALSTRITFIGMFFNQLLPGTLGGDSTRVLLSLPEGVTFKNAFMGVLADRVVALMALVGLVALSLPWLAFKIEDPRLVYGMTGLVACAVAGFLFVLWLPVYLPKAWQTLLFVAFLVNLGRTIYIVVSSRDRIGGILLLAIFGNLMYGAVVILCAQALDISLDPIAAVVLMLPTLLAMAIPISVAGWGVREGVMIVAFGQVGIEPADALAMSVVWGIVYMLAGIPGGLLWLVPYRKRHDDN